ncbi:glycosyltransferase [Cesiribacter andamanensis]|uniref:Poly-beta-1,6-N-acetyl-D-glucosamine synthase n=1 Tax=Cesiribacter andamanensis AMV16 TaxID=1279009 RepID=M7N0R5_9BACT|nr:glycosyltransferase [Cesiribacter andamanensis]EMR00907.1 Poly-beta-1,6-N-acetyl-D-glucosamine synthase [Cesiribacter andamanensis AMV16]
MNLLGLLCLLAGLLVIALDVWAWLLLRRQRDTPGPVPADWPPVAVLLPVRNEQEHLPACLQSLLQLEYPADKLLILVGNDASTDATLALARDWSARHPQIQLVDVQHSLGLARGKANVLAQLARACPREVQYFFMTDADIRPHPGWLQRMLRALRPGIGLVNGTTTVGGNGLWARWQQTDWAVALGLAKAYAHLPGLGQTLTAIGNNMLISREAYEATGGYEAIPFSITEDYELLLQIRQRGYEAVQLMDAPSSARTEPVGHLSQLLHQRKRWMSGAMRLPLPMLGLLFLQAFYFPAIVVVLWQEPLLGLALVGTKLLAQQLLAHTVVRRRLQQPYRPGLWLLYEGYSFVLSLALIVFYFLPLKIKWKDRSYQSNQP